MTSEAGAGIGEPEIERRGRAGQLRGPVLVEEDRKQSHQHRGDEGVVGPGRQRPGPLRGASRSHTRPSLSAADYAPGARASRESRYPASAPGELQVHARGRQIDQRAAVIQRQLIVRLVRNSSQLALIRARSPSARCSTAMFSNTHCTPYSSCSRNATTSNCSWPTAPRIRSLLRSGRNSCVAPSSHSWSSPLRQRLHAQRILEHRAPEHLRREIGYAGEVQRLAFAEAVADVDGAVVVQADDVAGVGLLGLRAIGGHEGQGIGDLHLLVRAARAARACRADSAPNTAAGRRCDRDARDPCWPGS